MAAHTTGSYGLRLLRPLILLSFLMMNSSAPAIGTEGWLYLAPGIEYRDLEGGFLTPWSHIHVFKINLQNNQLSLLTAQTMDKQSASIQQYALFGKSLLAINGGFFDKDFKPLGLRINQYQRLSPLKSISWWGVFYVKNNRAHIASARQFSPSGNIQFAVQSGPRLLINGQIPSLKPGEAERSALGITPNGQVIILVTDNAALSTDELAHLMKSPPLNCKEALNLDGGSSSQLQANIAHFSLAVHGFSHVSDAILVKAK